jgi:hypothetical protein
MRKLFTVFSLVFFSVMTQAQPTLPPAQFAWSDGALDGTRLTAWLYADAAKPGERKLYECRLAGVLEARRPTPNDTPENVVTLERLRARSLSALSGLISSGLFYVQPLSVETYSDCEKCPPQQRFLVSILSNASNETLNVLNLLLPQGLLYLSRIRPPSWTDADVATYSLAEATGRARRQGVWRYNEPLWREVTGARSSTTPSPLPTRRN